MFNCNAYPDRTTNRSQSFGFSDLMTRARGGGNTNNTIKTWMIDVDCAFYSGHDVSTGFVKN